MDKQIKGLFDMVRIVVLVLILFVGIIVALSPSLVYAPTPRVVLYFLISLLPAILFGAEATSKFQFKLPGFCFTTAGVFAACLGTLFVLTNLSKPEEKIAVFQVFDENGQAVPLDWDGALEVPITDRGLTVSRFVSGNTVILIFPEQVSEVELRIKRLSTGPAFSGTVGYAGSRTSKLFLGKQLKSSSP